MADKTENKTPAEIALFQMRFAVMMLNVDRVETANKCFATAETELQKLIDAGH